MEGSGTTPSMTLPEDDGGPALVSGVNRAKVRSRSDSSSGSGSSGTGALAEDVYMNVDESGGAGGGAPTSLLRQQQQQQAHIEANGIAHNFGNAPNKPPLHPHVGAKSSPDQQHQHQQKNHNSQSSTVTEAIPKRRFTHSSSCPPNFNSADNYQPQKQPQQQSMHLEKNYRTNAGTQSGTAGSSVDASNAYPNPVSPFQSPSPTANHDIVERSPEQRYIRFAEKLGSGAYKSVYRAYDTIEGIEVAWNVVNLSGMPKSDRARIVNEVRLLERLHHQNIISFHGSWVNRENEQVLFVTEILSSGTLKSFINKVQVIRWKIAKRWAVQILQGLEYLHSQNPPIIHRDLKCDNIFINGTSGDLRIGDFGLSTIISNRNKALSVLGTPEFMAPELYDESYDEKVDIYAFGMCLLEIFTKEAPYCECTNPAQIYKKVTKGILPASLKRIKSRHARDFIMLCLGGEGQTRPSASELLKHSFFDMCEDDESEVEVEQAMMEGVIMESATGSAGEQQAEEINKSTTEDTGEMVNSESTLERMDVDDGDDYNGMPDSEQNINNVTVLMGRGQEMIETGPKEDNSLSPASGAVAGPVNTVAGIGTGTVSTNVGNQNNPSLGGSVNTNMTVSMAAPIGVVATTPNFQSDNTSLNSQVASTSAVDVPSSVAYSSQTENPVMTPATQPPPQPKPQIATSEKYLVDACVIEKPNDVENHYADEIMKLIITLPIQGQTQNVQFDFHLVEDDPVQVAREMVTELHIPETAVLEISETISGLARAARVKQNRYKSLQQQPTQATTSHQTQPQLQTQTQSQSTQQQQIPKQTPDMSHPGIKSSDYLQTQSDSINQIHNQNTAMTHMQNPSMVNQADMLQRPNVAPAPAPVSVDHRIPQPQHQTSSNPPQPQAVTMRQQPRTHTFQQYSPSPSVSQGPQPPIPHNPAQPIATLNTTNPTHLEHQQPPIINQPTQLQAPTPKPKSQLPCDSSTESEDSNTSELRRLEEEYQKNLQRAKKAFVTRMDNLQRSMKDKEEQHQKTLEKHEKDLQEFEKRLKLAEVEQQRRLEQLENEWMKQREGMKKTKSGRLKSQQNRQKMQSTTAQEKRTKTSVYKSHTSGVMKPP